MTQRDYDAIVIGSGIGGLTTAALLARLRGKRVAVLEAHFKLGGFTHTFQRKGFHWDVGVHYIGGMHEGSPLRGVFDLVTGGTMKWQQMPHVLEVFHYPGLTVRVPSDPREYAAELASHFPDEADAITAYLADIRAVSRWYGQEAYSWSAPVPLRLVIGLAGRRQRRMGTQTTAAYLAERFRDPRLRAVVTSQWGDYGLPPAQSAFAMHALVAAHYLKGGFYPVGSSKTIAEGAVAVIEAAGGTCLVNHRVEEVLIERGRAVGVRVSVKKGRTPQTVELRAPLVISDAGAHVTAHQLLRPGAAPRLQSAVAQTTPSIASVVLYLGLKASPETLGFQGENHWYFRGFDHDTMREQSQGVLQGHPPGGYLSFPSLKDPAATRHTAEIITFADYADFERWAGQRWMRRGADYDELKSRIAEGLLDLVEEHHPGFRELVELQELSTPLTTADLTGHPGGQIYGLPATPERLRRRLLPARTEAPGLLLTGADVCSPGVAGALMGGVFAAGVAMGARGFPEIMRAARGPQGQRTGSPASSPHSP